MLFSSNQSWCLRDTGHREFIAEEWTVSLKTVQFSSTPSELCYSASKRLQIALMIGWLLLSVFSSLWLFVVVVQVEFADNKPVICPTVCTIQSLSLWHPVCPSFALWHGQWDASVLSKDASMITSCELVDGRPCWWSVFHALNTSLKEGSHCCCTSLLHLS